MLLYQPSSIFWVNSTYVCLFSLYLIYLVWLIIRFFSLLIIIIIIIFFSITEMRAILLFKIDIIQILLILSWISK